MNFSLLDHLSEEEADTYFPQKLKEDFKNKGFNTEILLNDHIEKEKNLLVEEIDLFLSVKLSQAPSCRKHKLLVTLDKSNHKKAKISKSDISDSSDLSSCSDTDETKPSKLTDWMNKFLDENKDKLILKTNEYFKEIKKEISVKTKSLNYIKNNGSPQLIAYKSDISRQKETIKSLNSKLALEKTQNTVLHERVSILEGSIISRDIKIKDLIAENDKLKSEFEGNIAAKTITINYGVEHVLEGEQANNIISSVVWKKANRSLIESLNVAYINIIDDFFYEGEENAKFLKYATVNILKEENVMTRIDILPSYIPTRAKRHAVVQLNLASANYVNDYFCDNSVAYIS